MRLTSEAFSEGDRMPLRFVTRGAGGENASPPFMWDGVPAGARSLALVVVDRAPVAHDWVHWLVVDLPPNTAGLAERASGADMPPGSRELLGTSKVAGWSGPQPPPGSGPHRYEAALYALDLAPLALPSNPGLPDVERAMAGHVIERAGLNAFYER